MPEKFKGATGTMFIGKVPSQVRDLFTAACRRRGKDNRTVLIDLMRKYIQNDLRDGIISNPKKRNRLPKKILDKRFD